MKITKVTEDEILFDNGKDISYNHAQECCEHNYADFEQLDDLARDYDFDENLMFEEVEGCGFRFGDKRQMFFVPCYSEQNGYYSSDVDIYYGGKRVLTVEGDWKDY